MAKIIIVDDSEISREMLGEILTEAGHTVVAKCKDGEEGFLKYQELKPDLVMLDITMPKIDGMKVLKMIRDYDSTAKVIMVTAAGQREKMQQAREDGAAEFITKPYETESLLEIMEGLLGG